MMVRRCSRILAVTALVALVALVSGLPETVRIGGLFETDDDGLEVAFRFAIDRINSNRHLLGKTKLAPVVDKVVADDSFHASKKVCSMLKGGVAAIFGPQSALTSQHVRSIATNLEVPHVETRWDFSSAAAVDFGVNLHPHPASLSKAYLDLVNEWKWKSFTIIYEDNQGLVRLQELLKADYRREVRIIVRQLDPGDDHRPLLKEIKKAGETKIVLDCVTEKVLNLFMQAQQIGMMTHYHNYLLTSLDLHTIDLEHFRYSGTNITAFRLINPDRAASASFVNDWLFGPSYHSRTPVKDQPITTKAALMYDAVHIFAQSLHDIDRTQPVDIQPLNCDRSGSWIFGNSIVSYMKNLKSEGVTGSIRFDENGFRTDFDLDIVSMTKNDLQKSGRWSTYVGVNITRTEKESFKDIETAMRNTTHRVTTKLSKPYFMIKEDHEKYEGNEKYEGFCVDLIKAIAEHLNITYIIKLVKDNSYGTMDKITGEWDGMMKELIDQEADIAVGDITITYDREQAVDFTMPFMNLGISILFKKPTKKDPNLFSFLMPLSLDVWMYMATAYLGVSVILFLLARLSPYEWVSPHPCDPEMEELENQFSLNNCMWFTIGSLMQQGCDFLPKFNPYDWENPHPCDPDPDELENKFGLQNSLWFTIGSLMQQGSDLAPKAISTRMVAGIWWFFTLIMISSYTANLAAFLTIERMDSPIGSVEDLAAQNKIKYGCVGSGTTRSFFKDSALPVYQAMWSAMESAQPSVFTKDNQEGVERVQKGGYAYLIESTANEYFTERHCELLQIGGLLDSKSYGVATPPGSPFRPYFSSAVLHLQEQGTLHLLKEKWWKREGGGKCVLVVSGDGSAAELGLANVGGVFVVLLGGMGLACVVGVMEFVWKTRKTVREERGDLMEEVKRELRFALKLGSNKKPVNKKVEVDAMTFPLTNYS